MYYKNTVFCFLFLKNLKMWKAILRMTQPQIFKFLYGKVWLTFVQCLLHAISMLSTHTTYQVSVVGRILRRPPGFPPADVHTLYYPLPFHESKTCEYHGILLSGSSHIIWQRWKNLADVIKLLFQLTAVNQKMDYLGGPGLIRWGLSKRIYREKTKYNTVALLLTVKKQTTMWWRDRKASGGWGLQSYSCKEFNLVKNHWAWKRIPNLRRHCSSCWHLDFRLMKLWEGDAGKLCLVSWPRETVR